MFIDESGYLLMPHVARTWGRRGQTPVLRHRAKHRQKVSAIAALSLSPARRRVGLYWQTHVNQSINQHGVLAFLKHLTRHLRGPLILVWDNINSHRSRLVKAYIDQHARLDAEPLPPYAPDLNPVEWLWQDGKCHALANHGLTEINAVDRRVHQHGQTVRHDQAKLRSFIRSAKLPLRL